MLARVQRLEQSRGAISPFALAYGSLDACDEDWQSSIDNGLLDPRDMPVVMMAVRRWHRDGVWSR